MFSKKDVENYLYKLRDLEITMQDHYKSIAEEIEDPEYKAVFFKLSGEESDHAKQFDVLLNILAKWKV
jgi:rubrerythrin